MSNKIYSFLGLAIRARKVVSGEMVCEKAAKSQKVYLMIVSDDSSENTKKKFRDICKYRNLDIRFFGEKAIIGKYLGKELRAVVAITDKGFAEHLKELIDNYDNQHKSGGEGIE